MKILKEYDPELESMGLDEGNLDLTSYLNEKEIRTDAEVWSICENIRKKFFEVSNGLTVRFIIILIFLKLNFEWRYILFLI